MTTTQLLSNNNNPVLIVSGEGTGQGHVEEYLGARTEAAINQRLTAERCNGDRWARAIIFSHEGFGDVYQNFETNELEFFNRLTGERL